MEKEVLRDRGGSRIGTIETKGDKQIIRDRSGYKLGEFDGKYTRDKYRHKIGEGNLLTTLLDDF